MSQNFAQQFRHEQQWIKYYCNVENDAECVPHEPGLRLGPSPYAAIIKDQGVSARSLEMR